MINFLKKKKSATVNPRRCSQVCMRGIFTLQEWFYVLYFFKFYLCTEEHSPKSVIFDEWHPSTITRDRRSSSKESPSLRLNTVILLVKLMEKVRISLRWGGPTTKLAYLFPTTIETFRWHWLRWFSSLKFWIFTSETLLNLFFFKFKQLCVNFYDICEHFPLNLVYYPQVCNKEFCPSAVLRKKKKIYQVCNTWQPNDYNS